MKENAGKQTADIYISNLLSPLSLSLVRLGWVLIYVLLLSNKTPASLTFLPTLSGIEGRSLIGTLFYFFPFPRFSVLAFASSFVLQLHDPSSPLIQSRKPECHTCQFQCLVQMCGGVNNEIYLSFCFFKIPVWFIDSKLKWTLF